MQETIYEKLFKAAPVPLIVTDGSGTIKLANEQADTLMDNASLGIIGLSFLDFIDQSILKEYLGEKTFFSFDDFLAAFKRQQPRETNNIEGDAAQVDFRAITLGVGDKDFYIWTVDATEIVRKLKHDLNERVKEQLCILNVIELCFQDRSLRERLRRCLQPIREGWRFPELTEVRISLTNGAVFATERFAATERCLQAEIRTTNEHYGYLDVCYRREVPAYEGKIFLYEELKLIDVLGKIIGTIIAHSYSSKRLNEAVVNAQEEERYQLAMELHDNVQQILTAASLNVSFLEEIQKDATAKEAIGFLKRSLSEAIDELRTLSQRLAPSVDPAVPLTDKIVFLTKSMGVNGRLKAKIKIDPGIALSEKIQLSFYRIIQEQLTNVLKHAKTPHVEITIEAEGQTVVLKIVDAGIGFDTSANKSGIGLENIRRRTEFMNGSLDVVSSPGKGTRITVHAPMEPGHA